ncbi:cation:proton antiporter [Streptomyces cinerochromogenes]|uniref:Cation:proton antiporter n=1 Tax=Streptomyces cinerochromogenes TaxID=66422 RepID=A0ABW7B740_9ACTN
MSFFNTPTDKNLALLLDVVPAVLVVLVASGVCGRLAVALRQPRVLGEMVAGVLLGPTVLGKLWPHSQTSFFSADVKSVLYVWSTVGLTLFMFLVGSGFSHKAADAREGGRAAVLALSGIGVPLVLGMGVGAALHGEMSLPGVGMGEFCLFLGGALSITAFPMLARILYERNLQHSRLGRLSLLGASLDDAAAWCFLAVLTALHGNQGLGKALGTIALAALFSLVMLVFVARALKPLGERVERTGRLGFDHLYIVLAVVLAAGWFTDLIGVYSVFGGFIAGLSMPKNPVFVAALHQRMMDMVCVLMLPAFFTFSGLNTQLDGIGGWSMLIAFLLMLAAAVTGKYTGCALAMRSIGFSWRESWAVGGLMNARGLMILIFINVGLADHIISRDVFSLLVLVAVVTTGMALPLFRWAIPETREKQLIAAASGASDPSDASVPASARS